MHVLWSYIIGHFFDITWTSFRRHSDIIWTSFGHHVNIIWTSIGHHSDMICTSFGDHFNIIWGSFEYHLGDVWTSFGDIIWLSFGHDLDIIWGSFGNHAGDIRKWFRNHVTEIEGGGPGAKFPGYAGNYWDEIGTLRAVTSFRVPHLLFWGLRSTYVEHEPCRTLFI